MNADRFNREYVDRVYFTIIDSANPIDAKPPKQKPEPPPMTPELIELQERVDAAKAALSDAKRAYADALNPARRERRESEEARRRARHNAINDRHWRIKQLRLSGMTYREIADELGRSTYRVIEVIHQRPSDSLFPMLCGYSDLSWMLSWTYRNEDELRTAPDEELIAALARAPKRQEKWREWDRRAEGTPQELAEQVRQFYPRSC